MPEPVPEPVEEVETIEPDSPAVSQEPIAPVEQVELVELVELDVPVESVEKIDSADQIEPAELVEKAELTELIEPIESTELSESDTQTLSSNADQDGDNVADAQDQCLASPAGYPVRSNGCALFDGVLSGVSFVAGSAALLPDATDQLDFLADVLIQHPEAKVELHAHTDNNGEVADQTALTRSRVETIGAYLVRRGVEANRMVLRSFGGSRPLYDNETAQGRTGNNRVEVIEARNQ